MARKSKIEIEREFAERAAEINAAAEARMLDMLPKIMAAVVAQRGGDSVAVDPATDAGDRHWARELASAIAKVGDPRNTKHVLDPVEATSRKKATDEMINLLVRFRDQGIVPLYKVKGKMYLNDIKIDPQYQDPGTKQMRDTTIRWPKMPNEAMEPVDEPAREIFVLYQRSQGNGVINPDAPAPPWMNPHTPWVFGKEGIVKGHPVDHSAELGQAAPPNQSLFVDPRTAASVPLGQSTTLVQVLGKTAPPVSVG